MYNVKLIWLSVAGFVWRWLLWCFESRARTAVARAAIFIVARFSKCVSDIMLKWKREIMNGNQGDHVNFVWSCRRSKHRSSFCRTFHSFIQHRDADAVQRHTIHSEAPMLQFLHRRVGMGYQALSFRSRANYVFKVSRMHACLQNVQPVYNTFNAPALWKTSKAWISSAARQERPSMFFNFTKIILLNIWIIN